MTPYLKTTLAAAMVAGFASAPSILAADEISLTMIDLPVTLTGDFIGFQQEAYIIGHDGANLHVPARYVSCTGTDCLYFLNPDPGLAQASNDEP